jgi:energy-coupling factor transport system ATP-binding protein
MADGRIEVDAPPQVLTSDRKLLRSLGLRRPTEAISTPWDELLIPNGHPRSEKPLLQLQNICAGYDYRKPILKDINLDFYPGEFIAMVGENGAGKSTLGLVIAGLLKPSHGQVFFDNRHPQPGLDVGLLFQNPTDQLFTESVDEEVAFGPRNFRRYDPERHQEILNIADLTALCTRPPFALSSGQQQRTAMSAVAALNPYLLILDEPTLGQDWGHLERLMDFLFKLNQRGTAILLITHDYKLVHHYAHRVIMLHDGQVQLDGHLRSLGEND